MPQPSDASAPGSPAARTFAPITNCTLALLLAACAAPPGSAPTSASVSGPPPAAALAAALAATRAHVTDHGPALLAEFAELLALPCVASDAAGIAANADWIVQAFARRGVTLEARSVDGHPPVILGRLPAGAPPPRDGSPRRTLGIYVHYDGQPVIPERWTFGPWTPTLTDRDLTAGGKAIPFPRPGEAVDGEARLYARGAGDDKAPLIALLAALDALGSAGLDTTSDLVFLFEGEEEAGSPGLGDALTLFADELAADLWLICDGPVHASRRPQLVFGVRGITSLRLTTYGATRGLHSGHYGNWSPNPALLLAQLLASMKDADGNVVVEGYLEQATPPGAEELAALAAAPPVDEALMDELSLGRTEGDGSLAERLLLPSLNVRGLASGGVGAQARNVIPPTATADLDLRLVAGCDPQVMQGLVVEHVRRQGFHVVTDAPPAEVLRAHPKVVRVDRGHGYRAVRTPMDHPLVPALTAAARVAADADPVLVPGLGGSLPLYLFEDRLHAPIVVLPIANHDDNQHAPDENIRLANLWYGVDLFGGVLTLP